MESQFNTIVMRLQRINRHINNRSSGTREQFAKQLDISVPTLKNYLSYMKNLGLPIAFDRVRQCYYYNCTGKIVYENRWIQAYQ